MLSGVWALDKTDKLVTHISVHVHRIVVHIRSEKGVLKLLKDVIPYFLTVDIICVDLLLIWYFHNMPLKLDKESVLLLCKAV